MSSPSSRDVVPIRSRFAHLLCLLLFVPFLIAQTQAASEKAQPWRNKALAPDVRADLLLKVLTVAQKVQLLHGTGDPHLGPVDPQISEENGGSGFVPGFPDLGVPALSMVDSAVGIAYASGRGRYSTWLPSDLALAASWDPDLAYTYGTVIGHELRDLGFNLTLGGGVNLPRDPRDGRTFEYLGGDPLLAGTMVGHLIQGVQSTHVIGNVKHFAVNDQESGRHAVSSEISERAMRETDLLAFQLGIEIGQPGAIMCAYNRVNGTYACEDEFLLNKVLREDWHFPGFVVSDWLATHSTVQASHAGLDQEEPGNVFFGPALETAVMKGEVPMSELDLHVHRVLRSMFADGVIDDPPKKQVPNVFANARTAQEIEAQSVVLLRNQDHLLPLHSGPQTIAVIGRNADRGMISGGGSAQVDPPGGNVIGDIPEKERKADWQKAVWFPTAPLASIKSVVPEATVLFADGSDVAEASALAKRADVVLVYAYQWQAEGVDLPTLALPDQQDALIKAVAKANPRTVVVLETGGPVLMPWLQQVAGVLAAWYGGTSGSQAIADILFGKVNPSGKLPLTFPAADSDLPHPQLVLPPPASQEDWSDPDAMSRKLLAGLPPFSTRYDEGLEVDYKWYDARHKPVLFPFGFGLSYTSYAYTDLTIKQGAETQVSFLLTNTGTRLGRETAQVYAGLPRSTGEPPLRLVGWKSLTLRPGEQRKLTLTIPPRNFQIWDEMQHRWRTPNGPVEIMAGPNSRELPLKTTTHLLENASTRL